MGRILAFLGALAVVGLLLFNSFDPIQVARREQSAQLEAERQQLELERQRQELERAQRMADATEAAQIGAGNIFWLLAVGAGVLILVGASDFYRQRRRPVVYPNQQGFLPVDRRLVTQGDQQIIDLLATAIRARGESWLLHEIHQPGQLPLHYAPAFEYRNDVQGALPADAESPRLTLPESIALAEVLPTLPRGNLAYGVLPGGELLSLPLAAGYHILYHGDTRSGKTNAIDAMLVQLHHKARHYGLRIIAGDFKRELAATWNRSPLVGVVETDPGAIAAMLEEIVRGRDGITERYALFERTGERLGRVIRNLDDYVKVTHERLPFTFIVVDELNAVLEAADKKDNLSGALRQALQMGAGAGVYLLAGAQYLTAQVFRREGSKQFVTRAHFGSYDKTAVGMMFGGNGVAPDVRELLSGQPGRGLIRTVGQAAPSPFQALRCDEDDILEAITIGGCTASERPGTTIDGETNEDRPDSEPSHPARTASERAEPGCEIMSISPEIAQIVQRLGALDGWGKSRIIETVWGVTKGGSRAYKDASAAYDEIMRGAA